MQVLRTPDDRFDNLPTRYTVSVSQLFAVASQVFR